MESDIPTDFFTSSAAKYAESAFSKCSGLQNVVAFIDGNVLEIARLDGPTAIKEPFTMGTNVRTR